MNWMAWTGPTAFFFIAIGFSLITLTITEIFLPTSKHRGFLPLKTTRGDRFFISLISGAFIHLFVLGVIPDYIFLAPLASLIWMVLVLRRG